MVCFHHNQNYVRRPSRFAFANNVMSITGRYNNYITTATWHLPPWANVTAHIWHVNNFPLGFFGHKVIIKVIFWNQNFKNYTVKTCNHVAILLTAWWILLSNLDTSVDPPISCLAKPTPNGEKNGCQTCAFNHVIWWNSGFKRLWQKHMGNVIVGSNV